MNGFPNIEKLQPLIGQRLNAVNCNDYQIIFEFDTVSITCEKGFSLIDKLGAVIEIDIPLMSSDLLDLIHLKVMSVTVCEAKKCLNILFENDEMVSFVENDSYETFTICCGEQKYIV